MKKQNTFHRHAISSGILFLILISLSGCGQVEPTTGGTQQTQPTEQHNLVDNWEFKPRAEESKYGMQPSGLAGAGAPKMLMAMDSASPVAGNIGLSVGGAKDVNNFRENLKNNFLPIPSDITPEGLYYNYFFDTGKQEECTKLFCPSYSTSISKDPFSKEDEYYLSVGLNSNIKESDFKRKKLNLVIVMDISGSMGSPFDQYYYDRFGNRVTIQKGEESSQTKIEIASKSVVALLNHLHGDDRFGMVLFDDQGYVAKPLSKVGDTDMKAIKDHVMELKERGGTNMDSGMQMGTGLFDEYLKADPEQYENRIIFITDAQPNRGDTSEGGLDKAAEKNAENGVYTSFIGVGVDFNTQLIESMIKIRGANYFSVHSDKEFKNQMDEGFDYMVTPLVFNLELKLNADGYRIEKVYGSPEADAATGEIMKVNTLFPSKTEGGQTRGGLVLLKLKKTGENGKLKLSVSYEDRNGLKDSSENEITFSNATSDTYPNTGIRKGILLARYANLMKDWLIDEFRGYGHEHPLPGRPVQIDCGPIVMREKSIIIPERPFLPPCIHYPELGQWERQSDPLRVSPHYRELFKDFAVYFEAEMKAIGDETLQQELDILKKLE